MATLTNGSGPLQHGALSEKLQSGAGVSCAKPHQMSSVVLLRATFEQTTLHGTGFLCRAARSPGPCYLLTAAHNVVEITDRQRRRAAVVVLKFNTKQEPREMLVKGDEFKICFEYGKKREKYDWARLEIASHALSAEHRKDMFTLTDGLPGHSYTTLSICGYPKVQQKSTIKLDFRETETFSVRNHILYSESVGLLSGAPVYYTETGRNYLLGIHVGYDDMYCYNVAVKIDEDLIVSRKGPNGVILHESRRRLADEEDSRIFKRQRTKTAHTGDAGEEFRLKVRQVTEVYRRMKRLIQTEASLLEDVSATEISGLSITVHAKTPGNKDRVRDELRELFQSEGIKYDVNDVDITSQKMDHVELCASLEPATDLVLMNSSPEECKAFTVGAVLRADACNATEPLYLLTTLHSEPKHIQARINGSTPQYFTNIKSRLDEDYPVGNRMDMALIVVDRDRLRGFLHEGGNEVRGHNCDLQREDADGEYSLGDEFYSLSAVSGARGCRYLGEICDNTQEGGAQRYIKVLSEAAFRACFPRMVEPGLPPVDNASGIPASSTHEEDLLPFLRPGDSGSLVTRADGAGDSHRALGLAVMNITASPEQLSEQGSEADIPVSVAYILNMNRIFEVIENEFQLQLVFARDQFVRNIVASALRDTNVN